MTTTVQNAKDPCGQCGMARASSIHHVHSENAMIRQMAHAFQDPDPEYVAEIVGTAREGGEDLLQLRLIDGTDLPLPFEPGRPVTLVVHLQVDEPAPTKPPTRAELAAILGNGNPDFRTVRYWEPGESTRFQRPDSPEILFAVRRALQRGDTGAADGIWEQLPGAIRAEHLPELWSADRAWLEAKGVTEEVVTHWAEVKRHFEERQA